jgi:hypothetical protein
VKREFFSTVIFKLFIDGIKDDKRYIIKNVYIFKIEEIRLKVTVIVGFVTK